MNIIRQVNQIPIKLFFIAAISVGLIITIPLSLYLVQKQTRLPSSAAPVTTPKPKIRALGPIPNQPPKVELITPFLGKAGDLVLIKGENLGNYPRNSQIVFGHVKAQDSDIINWTNNQIQVKVPWKATSGLIKVIIGHWRITWGIPFTVYDYNTKTKLGYKNNYLTLTDASTKIDSIYVWLTKTNKIATQAGFVNQIKLDRPPMSVAMYDRTGRLVPFYVDPVEFNF